VFDLIKSKSDVVERMLYCYIAVVAAFMFVAISSSIFRTNPIDYRDGCIKK